MVSGEGKAIDLATVDRVYFSDTPTSKRQQYSLRLKLISPDDSLTIACLAKTNDAGRASCKRLHVAIVRR